MAEPISTEGYANSGVKHTISRDESVRYDRPNDTSAPLQACHPPEAGQEGAFVLHSTNKRKDSFTTQIEDGIFDTINVLRYNSKKRPDKKSIPDYLARKLGADRAWVVWTQFVSIVPTIHGPTVPKGINLLRYLACLHFIGIFPLLVWFLASICLLWAQGCHS